MATLKDCELAIHGLIERLAAVDEDVRKKNSLDRSVSCTIPDIGVIFTGQVVDGEVHNLAKSPMSTAQIKLTVNSDDLLALTAGTQNIATAWASGKLKVEASVMDLLRIRSIF